MGEAGGFFRNNPFVPEMQPDEHFMNLDGFMTWLRVVSSQRTINLGHRLAYEFTHIKPCNDKRLSWNQRKKLGFCSVGKKELKFSQVLPLHQLWQGYMRNILNPDELKKSGWNNSPMHSHFEQLNNKLYRADFHGALVTVIQSKCPSYVGLTGIIVMETKNVFKILGQDNKCKMILKKLCQFEFKLDGLRFTFYGHNYITRPADRSNKKIKLIRPPTFSKFK